MRPTISSLEGRAALVRLAARDRESAVELAGMVGLEAIDYTQDEGVAVACERLLDAVRERFGTPGGGDAIEAEAGKVAAALRSALDRMAGERLRTRTRTTIHEIKVAAKRGILASLYLELAAASRAVERERAGAAADETAVRPC